MLILGVDPGLQGALAFFAVEAGTFDVHDMPVAKTARGSKIDLVALAHMIDEKSMLGGIEHAYLEYVSASPQMGVSSSFNFGRGYGGVEGVLAAHFVPTTYITPAQWKKAMRCPKDKEGARLRASQLLPAWSHLWTRKKDDGRAEAAMIALYGGGAFDNAAA